MQTARIVIKVLHHHAIAGIKRLNLPEVDINSHVCSDTALSYFMRNIIDLWNTFLKHSLLTFSFCMEMSSCNTAKDMVYTMRYSSLIYFKLVFQIFFRLSKVKTDLQTQETWVDGLKNF